MTCNSSEETFLGLSGIDQRIQRGCSEAKGNTVKDFFVARLRRRQESLPKVAPRYSTVGRCVQPPLRCRHAQRGGAAGDPVAEQLS